MTDMLHTTVVGPADRVRELLGDVLAGGSAFPVEVVVRGRGPSTVVDVFVDSAGVIGSDDLARISRELGRLMESEDVIGSAYRLNVSTPGADRPLRDLRQYPKHVGRTLELLLRSEAGEEESITGTLSSVEGDEVVLESADGSVHRVSVASIAEAKVKLPW